MNPLGIDARQPRLSWKAHSRTRGARQTAFQLAVADNPDDLAGARWIWDTGKVQSSQSAHHPYAGPTLQSRRRYWWQVRLWDEHDTASRWSEAACWEMGLLEPQAWQGSWITPAWEEDVTSAQPSPLLRREFQLKGPVAAARLYLTSLGLYVARLNGQQAGDWHFTPGWTSYHNRLQYQTYDVTGLVHAGANALAVTLGDGWYRGYLGFKGKRNLYGDRLALLLQLHITYADGSEETVVSDAQWRAATGPIRASDIYNGETYDARLERPGWDNAGYDDSDWAGVRVLASPGTELVAQHGPPVRAVEELKAQAISQSPAGETIVDFGQNLVGCVRLRVRGNAGDTVTVRHAEVLNGDGSLYTENLRAAAQSDRYTLKGAGEETFEPLFTFHGFRYVGISGYPGDLAPDDITAVVLHSDMTATGDFSCSHPLLNQLQHNIVWGQKGNFLDVPTDCPQRDERLGWTGDAQVFARTAAFNFLIAPFMSKWLRDLAADQYPDGAVPHVIPDLLRLDATKIGDARRAAGATGWGDAAVIVPWTLYLWYGDRQILAEQYPSMAAWVEYMRSTGENDLYFGYGFQFGDWLALDTPVDGAVFGGTDPMLIGTAFYAYSTDLLARTARVLGKRGDARRYAALHRRIVRAFQREFLTPAGRLASNTQTAYVLALMFDLLPESRRADAVNRLVEDIRRRDNHLSTGFLGASYLCPVLERFGRIDVAYDLLMQESYPSWLYPVTHGATTIWERWDGQRADGTFQNPGMNSFNHYAYGAIGAWIYRTVAGLDVDPEYAGFVRARVAPQPGGGLSWAKASLQAQTGLYAVEWQLRDGQMHMTVTVPANGGAVVYLPGARLESVMESGAALGAAEGCHNPRQIDSTVVVEIGAGEYDFHYAYTPETERAHVSP